MNDKRRRARIIATIGPASEKFSILGKLIQAGVDIFRFNLKYNTIESHRQIIKDIRKTALEQKKSVQIMIDLPSSSFSAGTNLAMKEEAEYVALSYLEQADEIIKFKQDIKEIKFSTNIISKIETKESLRHFDEILKETNSIMVARGDLGKSILVEKVPFAQKEIVLACQETDKIVIIATEMLLSMTSSKEPTRAEVSDVANAILEGCDAVMLSEETAIGENPIKAVEIMSKIIYEAENWEKLGYLQISSVKNKKFTFGK